MLPLSLLRTAAGHPMLVELKNGETYNGTLASCDTWMNIYLKDVICTSRDGDTFWKLPETVIRGANIKYLRIPEDVIDMVPDDVPGAMGKGKGQKGNRQDGGRGRGKGAKGAKGAKGKGSYGRGGAGRGRAEG